MIMIMSLERKSVACITHSMLLSANTVCRIFVPIYTLYNGSFKQTFEKYHQISTPH